MQTFLIYEPPSISVSLAQPHLPGSLRTFRIHFSVCCYSIVPLISEVPCWTVLKDSCNPVILSAHYSSLGLCIRVRSFVKRHAFAMVFPHFDSSCIIPMSEKDLESHIIAVTYGASAPRCRKSFLGFNFRDMWGKGTGNMREAGDGKDHDLWG